MTYSSNKYSFKIRKFFLAPRFDDSAGNYVKISLSDLNQNPNSIISQCNFLGGFNSDEINFSREISNSEIIDSADKENKQIQESSTIQTFDISVFQSNSIKSYADGSKDGWGEWHKKENTTPNLSRDLIFITGKSNQDDTSIETTSLDFFPGCNITLNNVNHKPHNTENMETYTIQPTGWYIIKRAITLDDASTIIDPAIINFAKSQI